ncbi:biopolymer transport protein ExbD [Rhodovulum imhoffii]|uniref:Biopolymer transport protein ExbD n=1 Tax=Rhodovulum imhoffii TaxID=365340 RepID=A0A2T5BWK9_9RHOB|nr:biopolymer transporter ExbD [Rhodovulum imhoffii]PTN04031.1 biopolymer transport protein ExbD [Rhodovulum imhoffii]
MFSFVMPRPPRRSSLTPMIDVVFLLLVFFMLAARFGMETGLEIRLSGAPGPWQGPPRLVSVLPRGVELNGVPVGAEALPGALDDLTGSRADTVVLRPAPGVDVQRLVTVMAALSGAGFTGLAVMEGAR